MKPQPFDPPEPTLDNCHDVRRLAVCDRCRALGKNLLLIGRVKRVSKYAHAFCLVARDGWRALATLPEKEINKTNLSDFLAWGLTIVQFNKKLREARK